MNYVIYPDEIFLKNFIMDLTVMFLVKMLLKKQVRIRRLAVGTAAASFLSTAALFFCRIEKSLEEVLCGVSSGSGTIGLPGGFIWYVCFVHFLVNPLMIFFLFREKKFPVFAETMGLSYLMYMFCGGVFAFLSENGFSGGNELLYYGILLFFLLLFYSFWEKKKILRQRIFPVTIRAGTQTVEIPGFHDTGNLLMDPYVKKPVNIIGKGTAQALFGEEWKNGQTRLVPYHALGKEEGLLQVCTVEEITVRNGKKDITFKEAVVGVTEDSFFQNCHYQMLINGKILNGMGK